MSIPKRHHFVPQFYLRRFSEDGASICCLHKKSGKFIKNASIKGQCAIDNYYSWSDDVEPMLGIVEGEIATLMREISLSNTLPTEHSSKWHDLLLFISLQHGRTKVSGDDSNAMADYYAKLMMRGRPEFNDINIEDFVIGAKFPAALPMEICIQQYHALAELGRALFVNNTKFPFVSSDNPVVFYNSQRSHIRDQGVIGLGSSGLQVFYPIDSNRLIYLYDRNIYSKPSNIETKKVSAEDCNKINIAHYMSSDEVVFCADACLENYIDRLHKSARDYLPFKRSIHRESEPLENEDGTLSSIMHSYQTQAPVEIDFSFAKHSKNINRYDTGIRSQPLNDTLPSQGDRVFKFNSSDDRRPHLRSFELNKFIKQLGKM